MAIFKALMSEKQMTTVKTKANPQGVLCKASDSVFITEDSEIIEALSKNPNWKLESKAEVKKPIIEKEEVKK